MSRQQRSRLFFGVGRSGEVLTGEKILVTGPAGKLAEPMLECLVHDNAASQIARFSAHGSRERAAALGVTARVCDLADGDFGDLPDDFTVVLHVAAHLGKDGDQDRAMRVNAEGTGLLLKHCRKARAVLIMSTAA